METEKLLSQKIKEFALQTGFVDCGIAKPHRSNELKSRIDRWLNNKNHATMKYMSDNATLRSNPFDLFPNVKSIVVVLANYNFGEPKTASKFKIARFAQGDDYHFIIKNRLIKILDFIQKQRPKCNGVATVDTMPVAERYWATQAGLGFTGLNTMFVHPKYGSWTLIGTLLLDIELEYDKPNNCSCLKCGKCIERCPNNALSPYNLNAEKCISFLTVEYSGNFKEENAPDLKNQIFGCDICNQVCPHNVPALVSEDTQLQPNVQLAEMTDCDWIEIGTNQFRKKFSKSPLKRAGLKKIRRNIALSSLYFKSDT